MLFFDSELHPLPLRAGDLADLRYFGVAGALASAGGPASPATREPLRRSWDALAPGGTARLREAGIAGFAAIGIGPLSIPWRGLEALLAELPDYLGRHEVVAVGAIGLEEGGAREEPVFSRQLALAHDLRLPVVVRTPWRSKERMTRRTLALLREQELDPARVLVTGVEHRTVKMVLACGYGAGLSLSAGAGDPIDAAVDIVRSLGPEGLVLGSGAGEGSGDLLALPRAAARMGKAGLSSAVVRRVCWSNGLRLFGLRADRLRDAASGPLRPPRPAARPPRS